MGAENSGAEIALDLGAQRGTWLSGRDAGHEPTRPGTFVDRLVVPLIWFLASPGHPGLCFVGLPFLHALTSSLMGGAGRDARNIADHIAHYIADAAGSMKLSAHTEDRPDRAGGAAEGA